MEPTGDPISDAWYYSDHGQQCGPVPLDKLRDMVLAGSLTRTQLVWREGLVDWVAAEKIPQLFTDQPEPLPAQAVGSVPLSYAGPAEIQYYNPQGAVVVYAGFWWRFLAWFIDYIILLAANYLLQTAMGFVLQGAPVQPKSPILLMTATSASLSSIIMEWLYYSLMESSIKQATLGKMVCGIIVTDERGSRIGFGRATGRYFGKIISGIILGIGYMMAGWTVRKQALHDTMAGTLVIKKNLPRVN